MPPEAVLFRIDGKPNKKGVARAVIYIDQRTVVARLNSVLGLEWSDAYEETIGGVRCKLTIMGVTRCDAGESRAGSTSPKAAHSDALKRASGRFEVGAMLKAYPRQLLALQGEKHLRSWTDGGGNVHWDLTFDAHAELRARYAKWVARADVVKVFGRVATEETEQVAAEVDDVEDDASPSAPAAATPRGATPAGPDTPPGLDAEGTEKMFEFKRMLKSIEARRRYQDFLTRIAMTSMDYDTWASLEPGLQEAIWGIAKEFSK